MAGMSLSRDLQSNGVAVAILHPGFVQTDMTGGAGDVPPDVSARVSFNVSMNSRWLRPEHSGTHRGKYFPGGRTLTVSVRISRSLLEHLWATLAVKLAEMSGLAHRYVAPSSAPPLSFMTRNKSGERTCLKKRGFHDDRCAIVLTMRCAASLA